MDVLTEKRVLNWAKQNGFEGSTQELFELYAANIYLQGALRNTRVLEQVAGGGGDDGGVDAAAVIINGQVVEEDQDLEEVLIEGGKNSIELFFMQAKTSQSWDMKLISKFLHGVESICGAAVKPKGDLKAPERWRWVADLIISVIENIERFTDSNKFGFRAIYVTTSDDDGSSNVRNDSQVQSAVRRIESFSIFDKPLNFVTHGQNELFKNVQELNGPQNVKFDLPKRVSLPQGNSIEEAQLGLIDGVNLKKLLLENGKVRRHIFDANVRLYQGRDNEVNKRIQETLNSRSKIGSFPFLNNGLTVVANQMRIVGDVVTISSYHIVNGGQTSIEIIHWMESAEDEDLQQLYVPLKIISSDNAEIRREISVATNLQTAINETDIQGSTRVAQRVEEYFDGSGGDGLRYQRQSSSENIEFVQLRVFDTDAINRAMESCILGNSSRTTRSPKDLKEVSNPIWVFNFPLPAYYFSAWVMYRVDSYFNRNKNQKGFAIKAARYHIGMMAAALTVPELHEVFEVMNATVGVKGKTEISKAVKLLNKIKIFKTGHHVWASENISEDIDNNIEKAVGLALDYFSDALKDGAHLKKDDVRNNSVQTELVSLVTNND